MSYDPRFSQENLERQRRISNWVRECDHAHFQFQREEEERRRKRREEDAKALAEFTEQVNIKLGL